MNLNNILNFDTAVSRIRETIKTDDPSKSSFENYARAQKRFDEFWHAVKGLDANNRNYARIRLAAIILEGLE